MPKHYCCVPKCSSHSKKHTFKFFRIPVDRKLRSKWKLKIGRGHTFSITDHTRICGNHFVSGKRSYDPADVDYIPSIFQFSLKPKNRYCMRCRRSTCKCKVSVNTNEPQGNANDGQDGTDNAETSTSNNDGDVNRKLQDEMQYLRIQIEHDANTILRQSAKIEELTARYQQQLEKKDEIIEDLRNKIIQRNILHQKDTAELLTSKDAALENLKSSFAKSTEDFRKLHKRKLESLDTVKN